MHNLYPISSDPLIRLWPLSHRRLQRPRPALCQMQRIQYTFDAIRAWRARIPRLTIFGRSVLLLSLLVLANAVVWIATGILFGRDAKSQPVLSLALLAWTTGLRHALDADHISAIDNATRSLIGLGQLPVTCGLFFSLGHSTIVIVVNVAIALGTSFDRFNGLSSVGGVVGSAVSGSFLFIVGSANAVILYRILRQRRRDKARRNRVDEGADTAEAGASPSSGPNHNTFLMRIIGPVLTFVDRPWKMYIVGILFGLGFDTASSIALLSISAIAQNTNGHGVPPGHIVVLPLLFTTGMSLIDSIDSVLMLYSYAGLIERGFAFLEKPSSPFITSSTGPDNGTELPRRSPSPANKVTVSPDDPVQVPDLHSKTRPASGEVGETSSKSSAEKAGAVFTRIRARAVERNMRSDLSLVLTGMSILVAFTISIIVLIGLIGDECGRCRRAAGSDPGLVGRWWRFWSKANDNSGFIGAAIVGAFVFVVAVWYGVRWAMARRGQKRPETANVGSERTAQA